MQFCSGWRSVSTRLPQLFSATGSYFDINSVHSYLIYYLQGLGSVRTATKRAGGTVRNHGHSPGKRLGIKKFSGTLLVVVLYNELLREIFL